jgi:hypothetical protein
MKKKDMTKQFFISTERSGADHKTPNTISSAHTFAKATIIYFRKANLDFILFQNSFYLYFIQQVRRTNYALGSFIQGLFGGWTVRVFTGSKRVMPDSVQHFPR